MVASALVLLLSTSTVLVKSDIPEELEDLQTEFYMPYSETEDVDYTFTRPPGYGCYQWCVN